MTIRCEAFTMTGDNIRTLRQDALSTKASTDSTGNLFEDFTQLDYLVDNPSLRAFCQALSNADANKLFETMSTRRVHAEKILGELAKICNQETDKNLIKYLQEQLKPSKAPLLMLTRLISDGRVEAGSQLTVNHLFALVRLLLTEGEPEKTKAEVMECLSSLSHELIEQVGRDIRRSPYVMDVTDPAKPKIQKIESFRPDETCPPEFIGPDGLVTLRSEDSYAVTYHKFMYYLRSFLHISEAQIAYITSRYSQSADLGFGLSRITNHLAEANPDKESYEVSTLTYRPNMVIEYDMRHYNALEDTGSMVTAVVSQTAMGYRDHQDYSEKQMACLLTVRKDLTGLQDPNGVEFLRTPDKNGKLKVPFFLGQLGSELGWSGWTYSYESHSAGGAMPMPENAQFNSVRYASWRERAVHFFMKHRPAYALGGLVVAAAIAATVAFWPAALTTVGILTIASIAIVGTAGAVVATVLGVRHEDKKNQPSYFYQYFANEVEKDNKVARAIKVFSARLVKELTEYYNKQQPSAIISKQSSPRKKIEWSTLEFGQLLQYAAEIFDPNDSLQFANEAAEEIAPGDGRTLLELQLLLHDKGLTSFQQTPAYMETHSRYTLSQLEVLPKEFLGNDLHRKMRAVMTPLEKGLDKRAVIACKLVFMQITNSPKLIKECANFSSIRLLQILLFSEPAMADHVARLTCKLLADESVCERLLNNNKPDFADLAEGHAAALKAFLCHDNAKQWLRMPGEQGDVFRKAILKHYETHMASSAQSLGDAWDRAAAMSVRSLPDAAREAALQGPAYQGAEFKRAYEDENNYRNSKDANAMEKQREVDAQQARVDQQALVSRNFWNLDEGSSPKRSPRSPGRLKSSGGTSSGSESVSSRSDAVSTSASASASSSSSSPVPSPSASPPPERSRAATPT